MVVRLENSGYEISLDRPFGSGGMGTTYLHQTNDGMVAKEMHDEFPEEKVRYLIARPLVPSRGGYAFAWPTDIGIEVATGKAKMYFMPKAENAIDLPAVMAAADWLPKKFTYRVMHNKVRALRDLERAGYQRGDMPNAMVGPDGFVTEIDLDSLQISHADVQYLCGVGKPDWLAPELISPLMAGELGDIPTTSEHDAWSVPVSLWMLLRGDHPYDCRYTGPGKRPTRIERTERGYWAYSTDHPDFQPRRGTPPLADLDPDLVFLFRKTFDTGHSKATARPNLSDWEAVLSRLDTAGDVTLSDEQWHCVAVGDRPKQRLHRKLRRAPIKQQVLVAASLAVIGSGGIYWNQQQLTHDVAPVVPPAAFSRPASQLSTHDRYESPTSHRSVPPIKLHTLKNPGQSEPPALWSQLKENLQ